MQPAQNPNVPKSSPLMQQGLALTFAQLLAQQAGTSFQQENQAPQQQTPQAYQPPRQQTLQQPQHQQVIQQDSAKVQRSHQAVIQQAQRQAAVLQVI